MALEKQIEPQTFEEACHIIANEIAKIVISKQHDYGHDNILGFGEYGVLVRVNDKIARLKNLYGKDKLPQNETIAETWQDNAGYSIIALMLKRGWFVLPLEEDKK